MSKIAEIFKLPARKIFKGSYGVEIEVEGNNLPILQKYWRTEADGSLRGNSREYVMSAPGTLRRVEIALKSMRCEFKAAETVINESPRAGVHVHVNAQQMTPVQLATFITIYLVLEDLIVEWCGTNRIGNLFCLRTKDAEGFYEYLYQAFVNKHLKTLSTDDIRYCSINLASLSKYGSVEFRAMRSTSDLNEIYTFVKILDKIVQASTKYKTPRDVVDRMSFVGPSDFVEGVMQEYYPLFIDGDIQYSVYGGVRRVQDFAYDINWDEYDIVVGGFKVKPLQFNFDELHQYQVLIDDINLPQEEDEEDF